MLQFFIYDTATGRVLGVGTYDERGDGAAARGVAVGTINPDVEYAPGGVKTARPVFNLLTLLLDKTTLVANGVDMATISGIPNGTVVEVFKDQDVFPRGVATVTDGSLQLRVDAAGVYRIVLENFPTQSYAFQVVAT
jgi:hypothetical protein